MPDPAVGKYDRDPVRMDCLGLDLNRPVDSVRPGRFPILKNVRSYKAGEIDHRPGLTSLGQVFTDESPTHSIRRLNDPNSNDYTRIIGAGFSAAYGKIAPFTQLGYGGAALLFSGDPLALIPYQPEESPQSWMFMADRAPNLGHPAPANVLATTLKKVKLGGTVHQVGMPAPFTYPTATLAQPRYKFTDPDFDFEYTNSAALQADWVADGVVAAAATLNSRVATTISAILYDSGSTGWAEVKAAAMTNIGVGMIILVNGGGGTAEKIVVEEVHAVSASTTIASIIYDSGTSGMCSIVLTDNIENIDVNSLLNNTTQSEFNRVLNVTTGPNGSVSLRCSTAATYAAGDAILFAACFRAYFANNHAATETLVAHSALSAVTTGTGYFTRTANYDFSSITSSLAATVDDYIHLSIYTDAPGFISEVKLEFDCDVATHDFTKNFFYASISPSSLIGSSLSSQTLTDALNSAIQVSQTNQTIANLEAIISGTEAQDYSPQQQAASQQLQELLNNASVAGTLSLGTAQWSEIRLKLSDFIRVGTDLSRGWANIAAVRVQVTTTGNMNFGFDDIQLGGGYGPDQSATAVPYVYRFRARCTSTNAKSNPSAPTRGISFAGQPVGGGVTPYREAVTITIPQYLLATEADVLDIERYGGDIANWHYLATIPNSSTPSFTDTIPDDVIATQPRTDVVNGNTTYGLDSFQPWPIRDTPKTGTGTSSGTTITDSGSNFNTLWSIGTAMIFGGISCTIYRVISTSKLELFENVGNQSGVAWNIPVPIVCSQPLPCLWGPLNGVLFACGDTINAGRLYFTQVNSEGCTDSDYYDVTPTSEPLMNGLLYNNRSYLFSSERFFQILQENSIRRFIPQEIPNGKGLFSRWAMTREPGPIMYFLSRDGIYATDGSTPISITDEWLYPLFPTEAQPGKAQGIVGAPLLDSSLSVVRQLRLDFAVDFLYFDYVSTVGDLETLVWNPDQGGGWFYDKYAQPISCHYADEGPSSIEILVGGANALGSKLYQLAGPSDDGLAISCRVRTPSRDQGDSRSLKYYGDVMIDSNPQGVDLIVTPGINNFDTSFAPTTLNFSGRNQKAVNIQAISWTTARNIAVDLTWDVDRTSGLAPLLYIWESRSVFESAPISALSWEISPTTFGMENFKSLGFGRISLVSSTDVTLIVTIDGVAQSPLVIPSSVGVYAENVFRFPVYKAKEYKFRLSSTSEFRLAGRDSFIEVKEWGSNDAYRQLRVFGDYAFIEG